MSPGVAPGVLAVEHDLGKAEDLFWRSDEANRKLADERRKREDFIQMVVHDLATPLTTIDGYVQVLGQPDVSAALEQRARTAASN